MGRYVKPAGEGATTQYWYPGERNDYVHTVIVLGVGLATAGLIAAFTASGFGSALGGLTVGAALAGIYLGRRDGNAVRADAKPSASTVGSAGLRALAKGAGGALAAVVITRAATGGFWAEWVLPLVPALVGAAAHQIAMTKKPVVKRAPIKASESAIARAVASRKAAVAGPATPGPVMPEPAMPEPAMSGPVVPETAMPGTAGPAEPVVLGAGAAHPVPEEQPVSAGSRSWESEPSGRGSRHYGQPETVGASTGASRAPSRAYD